MTNTVVLETVASTGKHPSFPDGMPAMIAEPVVHGYCTDCASLASAIHASKALGDRGGMVDYGWQAIRHWFAVHEKTPAVRGRRGGVTPIITGGAR